VKGADDGVPAEWTTTCVSVVFLTVGGVLAACGVALLAIGPVRLIGLAVSAVGIAMLALSSVSVTADQRGVSLAYGPWRLIRQRIPLDRIAAASAIDVRPMKWGGWGYRGSLRIFRRAAVVLRGGPGLRLDLRDGAVFTVTVDQPEVAAALINRYVQSRRDHPG